MSPGNSTSVPQSGDDASLQPERTGLAWNRTLVVLAIAFGILGVHAFHDGVHAAATAVCGLIAALVLVLSSPFARARSHAARELLQGSITMMSPISLLALAATASALALASLILIILRG